MNLNSDLFLNRNFIIKRKPRINLDILNTIPKSTYSRLNILKNRYSKFPNGEYLFEDNNRMNQRKIVNNIITPSEKSYFTESNQSQIYMDIIIILLTKIVSIPLILQAKKVIIQKYQM